MKKRGLWKIVAATLLILIVVTVGIVQMVLSGKLNGIIVSELEKETGSSVTLSKCKVSLFPSAGIHIEGLEISSPQGDWDKGPIIKLGKVKAKVATLPLLSGSVNIRSFLIEDSELLYEINEAGVSNIETILATKKEKEVEEKSPQKEEKHWKVLLKNYTIKDLKLRYIDHNKGERYELNSINQKLALSLDTKTGIFSTTGILSISDIVIKMADQPTLLNGVTFALDHDVSGNLNEKAYTITNLATSFNNIALTLKGEIVDTSMDITVNTKKINFSDILKEVPSSLSPELSKLSCGGTIQLNVTAKGALSKPSINGNFDIDNGLIKYSDLPESINSIFAKAHFTENSIDISRLALNVGKDPVSLKAKVKNFSKPDIDASVQASVNLDNLKKSIKLPEGHKVSGKIISDFTAKGVYSPTNPTSLAVSGGVQFKEFSFITPEVAQTIKMNGTVDLTPQSIVQKMELVLGESDLTYKGSIKNWQTMVFTARDTKGPKPVMNFSISSNLLNIDKLLPKNESKKSTAQSTPATTQKNSDEAVIKPILTEALPDLNVTFSVNAKKVIYDDISLQNLSSKTTLYNDKAKFSLNFNLFGGRVTSNQTLNAKDLKNLHFSSTFNILNIDANKILSHYNNKLVDTKPLFVTVKKLDNGIHGTMSLKTSFHTNGHTNADFQENIDGSISASLTKGYFVGGTITKSLNEKMSKFLTFDDVHYRTLETSLRIKDERVHIDTLKIDSRLSGEWKAYGSVGFDATLDMKLEDRLPLKISQKLTGATDKVKSEVTKGIQKKLGGALGDFASGVVEKQGIPTDAEGRVSVLLGLTGTTTKPKVKALGFKKGSGTSSSKPSEDLKNELKKKAKEELDKAKKELEERARKEAEKARKEAEKKAEELKKKAEEELKKKVSKETSKKISKEAEKSGEKLKKKLPKKFKKLF